MAARARRMLNHAIGISDLVQHAAPVVCLAATRLARAAAQAAREARLSFFNLSLDGGLELFELSCPNCRDARLNRKHSDRFATKQEHY